MCSKTINFFFCADSYSTIVTIDKLNNISHNPAIMCKRLLLAGTTLVTEPVERTSLSLEGVHDIHGHDGLAAGMLGVRDGVANDRLEEDLEDVASLFVDETGDALDTTPAS